MQKDKVKSIIYNIKGKPNFNGYRGTLYESKYKKYFLYNGAEKAFKENEDNKMILDTENNKLYINGSEFTEPTFSQLDVDKPIQDGLICWLDGYDKNENTAENLWRSRVGNNHFALTGVTYDETSGWQDDGSFKFDGFDDIAKYTFPTGFNFTENDFTLNIKYSDYVKSTIAGSRILHYIGTQYGLCLFIPVNVSDKLKYFVAGTEHVSYTQDDDIISVVKSDMIRVYYNGFYIFEIPNTLISVANRFSLGGIHDVMQSDIQCANYKLKSFLLYNRALTPEEVKHNYIYERYYRDKQKEINLNVRPLVQEIGINEGISIANDSHKEITVNPDGTFNNSDNTVSGQKVRHIVNRRKICNRNVAKQSEFMLGRGEFQIVPTKISDTAWRLVKKLTGTEEHLHGFFRHNTPKTSIYTMSFYVVKMTGDWSFSSYMQSGALLTLGWNKISVDPSSSKVIGFYCNSTSLEGELIFEHYKCEEGNIFTGMNDTEYDLYEEEYVEGLYKGKNTTNLATDGVCGIYVERGYRISDKKYKDGWWEVTVNGSDEGVSSIPYLYLSKPTLEVGTYTFSSYIDSCGYDTTNKIRVDGKFGLYNVDLDSCGKFKLTGDITTAGAYGIHIILRGILNNQKFRWRDEMIQLGKDTPYVTTTRSMPKQIYTIPKVSGITVDLFSLYMEIYNPHRFDSTVTETKPLWINGNHLAENAGVTVSGITAHSAYSIYKSDIESGFVPGKNIMFIYNRNVYLNGVRIAHTQGQTNYNTNILQFNNCGATTPQSLNGISVISEVYKSSDLAHLTEQDCINISKYGLKRYNDNKLIPMREVEKL